MVSRLFSAAVWVVMVGGLSACPRPAKVQTLAPEVLKERLARFQAEQRDVARHWLFATPPGATGDASPVLSRVTGFRASTAADDVAGESGVPATLQAELKQWGKDWLDHVDDADLTGLELGWMKGLAHFAVWDLEAEGSPGRSADPTTWVEAPIPNFTVLSMAAKARLLHGLRAGEGAAAAAEVRALARLSATTEMHIGNLVGIQLAAIEAKARAVAVERSHDLRDWPTATSPDEIAALKRVVVTASQFFHIAELDREAEDDIVVGRCAAIADGAKWAIIGRDLLKDAEPARYATLAQTIRDADCRLTTVRAAWNQPPLPAREALAVLTQTSPKRRPSGLSMHLLWIPQVRASVGRRAMQSIGKPLVAYDDDFPEKMAHRGAGSHHDLVAQNASKKK
jgi:hypothetical protein